MIRIAIAQTEASDDLETNLARAESFIAEAGSQGARLVVFPEIHLSPFFPKTRGGDASGWLVARDSPVFERLSAAARQSGAVVVSNLYFKGEDGKAYDASPVFDADGTLLGLTYMNEISQFDGFWEQDYYTPGQGLVVYETAIGRLAVVICWDRHFPECYRAVAKAGAQIVVTPTCIEAGERLDLFEAEMRTLSFQNIVVSCLANRCGPEAERAYAGQSMIVDATGERLARAGSAPQLLFADIDLEARDKRAQRLGFLSSRTAREGVKVTKA